jgi:hypothetical protein
MNIHYCSETGIVSRDCQVILLTLTTLVIDGESAPLPLGRLTLAGAEEMITTGVIYDNEGCSGKMLSHHDSLPVPQHRSLHILFGAEVSVTGSRYGWTVYLAGFHISTGHNIIIK